MRKTLAMMLAAALMLTVPAMAAQTAAAPAPFRAEYEGGGRVEIDFRGDDVKYQNVAVTAAAPDGAAQTVTILEVDDDDLTFLIENVQPSTTYSFTVSGVKLPGGADYESLTGEITTPAAGETAIQKVELDDGSELEIEFAGRVAYENAAVTVTSADGTALNAVITERDDDSIEVRVDGISRGDDYTVTVSGVGEAGSGIFGTVQRTFTAR